MLVLKVPAYEYVNPEVPALSPAALLDALFARSLSECERARSKPETRGAALQKTTEIVKALAKSLDHRVAPDLCQHLAALYDFILDRLSTAAQSDGAAADEPLLESERILRTLRGAFADATQSLR